MSEVKPAPAPSRHSFENRVKPPDSPRGCNDLGVDQIICGAAEWNVAVCCRFCPGSRIEHPVPVKVRLRPAGREVPHGSTRLYPGQPEVAQAVSRSTAELWGAAVATKVIPVPPELDTLQIREDFAAFHRSTSYFSEHYKELLEEFPDRWIALWVDASGARTVVSGNDVDSVARRAKTHGMSLARSYLRYMATEPRYYI